MLNDRVKKKKKVFEGTTNKKRSVREASSSPPCSSSKDPLSKVFRDLRVFLEGSQTITKSSIGEILSGTSGGFRSLFRIEIKSVTSACDSARRKMEMGLGVGRGVSRRSGEGSRERLKECTRCKIIAGCRQNFVRAVFDRIETCSMKFLKAM